MTEKEFRLESLKRKQKELKNKRIVLYGTGVNAEFVLKYLPQLNILALMDENHIGDYLYGKKIISINEVRVLKIDVIIIAAEADSSYIVSERIRSFCIENQIVLLNMYGHDEVGLQKEIWEQELKYPIQNRESLMRRIDEHDVICFQLLDVLCAYSYFDSFSFWKALEEKIVKDGRLTVSNFARNREKAEGRLTKSQPYTTETVYNMFQTVTAVSREEGKTVCEQEEKFLVEKMIPKKEMIALLNRVAEQNKSIYIISELHLSRGNLEKLLHRLGIKEYKAVIQESLCHLTFSKGALRVGLGEDLKKKVLYIGINKKNQLLLPQLYGMDIFLLKDSWSIMKQFSEYKQGKENFAENIKKNAMEELVQYTYNSPFIDDNSEIDERKASFSVEMKGGCQETDFRYKLDLFPVPEFIDIAELECLNFPVYENPEVTVIIPVYNQFKYTYNCLQSVLKNTENVTYEVILADDCSTDDTRQIEEVVKGIRVIHNEKNLSFLLNCNQASKYARGKYILFLNNDTQVLLNWLFPLVRLMKTFPEAGLVGSKLLYADGRIQEAGGIIWKDGSASNFGKNMDADEPECNYVREVDYVTGASIMIERTLWEEIGGFDERYAPAYCEDSDLAFEVRLRGRKVLYQPASEVVHFEGASNGKDVSSGIKAYQVINTEKLRLKWKNTLERENYDREHNILPVRDRKGKRKTILFFSETVPRYDCDAGSKTIFSYLKLFLKKGFIIKYVPSNFVPHEPYTFELRQMGIEVLTGTYCKKKINKWILENEADIDFALLNYPSCAAQFIRTLRSTFIKVFYYGHDLHFLRNQREYELYGDISKKELSKEFYEKEKYVIERADVVYYPSTTEVNIVKQEFKKEDARVIPAYIFEVDKEKPSYKPDKREGIIFVGGFGHPPNIDAVLWFFNKIYLRLYEEAAIPFYIVGSNEPYEIQQINHPGIIHKGFLTDDELMELYQSVKMAVVPLRYGAGVKGKVVEAMHLGIPMISTSIGIEGIPEAEKYIPIEDEEEGFVRRLMELYFNNKELREISLSYGNIIEKYYSEKTAWDAVEKDFISEEKITIRGGHLSE